MLTKLCFREIHPQSWNTETVCVLVFVSCDEPGQTANARGPEVTKNQIHVFSQRYHQGSPIDSSKCLIAH